jgi:glycosyltransferase involved in cell wall biosynthesis
MKIAFVTDAWWPRINGVTVSVQTFRDELEKRGHQTLVLAPLYPGQAPDPAFPPVKRFPSVKARLSPEDRLVIPLAFPAVYQALSEFDPDIVHFNSEFSLFFAGRLWCHRHGKPILITCHTNWELYIAHYAPWISPAVSKHFTRRYMRHAYLDADYVLIPSPQIGDLLDSYGISGPYHVLPTGIAPSDFAVTPEETSAFRARLNQEAPGLAGKRLLLYVGRMGEEKGISMLLPVLKKVLRSIPDAALLMIGDGPARLQFIEEAEKAGLGEVLHAPGYLPRNQLRMAYTTAEAFVFPSMTETQGLTTIEAMMCGTPVVGIGVLGTKDVMQGDNGGFLLPDGQPEPFADAVIRLLSDAHIRRAKSHEARLWAGRFSVRATTDSLLVHYQECLAGEGRRKG